MACRIRRPLLRSRLISEAFSDVRSTACRIDALNLSHDAGDDAPRAVASPLCRVEGGDAHPNLRRTGRPHPRCWDTFVCLCRDGTSDHALRCSFQERPRRPPVTTNPAPSPAPTAPRHTTECGLRRNVAPVCVNAASVAALRRAGAPLPDDLTGVLGVLVADARRILGANYVGAYLQGSISQGAADLESDCDFLVVISRPLSASSFTDLADLHASLPTRPGHWSTHLEGSYPIAEELATLRGLGAGWAYVDHGSRSLEETSTHCNTPVTRRILRDHGIALDGPPAKTLVEPVPDDVIRNYSRDELARYLQEFDSWSTKDAWSQRYSVLTIARLICSIQTGRVVSKRDAALWAQSSLDSRWSLLIQHMLEGRGSNPYTDPPDPAWVEQTHAFGRFARGWTPTQALKPGLAQER